MAPRQPRNSDEGHTPQGQDCDMDGNKDKGHVDKMSLLEKLSLSSALWGTEATMNFAHLYTMPILQILGLPLSMVSLIGVAAGTSSILLLSLLCWVSDQGLNAFRRKAIATIFGSSVMISGMLCVIVANALHFNYLNDYNSQIASNSYATNNVTVTPGPMINLSSHSSRAWDSVEMRVDYEVLDSMYQMGPALKQSENGSLSPVVTDLYHESSEVPFKAGLGMLGFIFMDMGSDLSVANIKSFVIECGPRSEHTSLLVIGLIMASAGGMSTAALGMVDFTSILGLTDFEGARLTIQTTVQSSAVIICLVLGLFISLLTGHRRFRRQNIPSENAQPTSKSSEESIPCEDQLHRSFLTETFENSIRSLGAVAVHIDPNLALLENHKRDILPDIQGTLQNVPTEHTPLLAVEEVLKENEDEMDSSHHVSISMSIGDNFSGFSSSVCSTATKTTVDKTPEDEVSPQPSACVRRFKLKILLIVVSGYFAAAEIFMFTMTSSDYVGKAIYGGDPEAPPGSESLAQYQEGVRMSSWGFFIYYASYLVISFFHSKILALLGPRLEFISAQLLMAALLLALILTARLEVYFVLTAIAALQRACFFAVPFTVINDLIQSMPSKTNDGKNRVGLAMGMVTACSPMAYCTMYTWVGPLEELTGQVAIPFWLASGSGVLSALAFFSLGTV